MEDIVIQHVNSDVILVHPVHSIKFIDGKLYQYQWSQDERKWAWYLVEGQEDK